MKKSFLIPTILAIGSTAVLPVVSCKDTKEEIQTIKISGDQEVIKGKSATYSAEVTASSEKMDKTVTWSIILDENKTGSTINATTGEFTAGNIAGKVAIRATSVVDETKHDEFDINVVSAIKITIEEIRDLEWDDEYTCKATVKSPSGYDQTITWEIEGDTTSTIDPNTGKITTGEKSESFLVKATSVFDSASYATIKVNVVSPVKSITIVGPDEQYFGDNCTYTGNIEVTSPWSDTIEWYIDKDESETGSKINKETGAFEAGNKAGTVVIKAVPVADPLSFKVVEVEIESPIDWVKVDNVADIEWNGQYTCHAVCYRVRGYSGEVTWSIDEPNASATIDPTAGIITAGTKTETITVRATSVLDPTKSGTTSVKIISPIKSVSVNKQTQALPTNGEADYSATVVASPTWSTDVTWEIAEGEETGSSIDDSGHFIAGTKEGKVVIKAISAVDANQFATFDVYVRNTCPISSMELESDNAIVFGQSTVVKTVGIPTIEGICVAGEITSCDVGDTGATWNTSTNTLTAGNTAGDVTLTYKPIGYSDTYSATISIAQNVFESLSGQIKKVADPKFTRVSVLPTITESSGTTYNVTKINGGAFEYANTIKSVNLEKATNLSEIGGTAFKESGITSLYIPKSVVSISYNAFIDCKSMTNVFIEENSQLTITKTYSKGMFSNCSNLKTINLENATKLSCVDEFMFSDCGELTSLTIPENVVIIGRFAFSGCGKLATINFAGTMSQWKAIARDYSWHSNVPTNIVHCSDGDCELDETL